MGSEEKGNGADAQNAGGRVRRSEGFIRKIVVAFLNHDFNFVCGSLVTGNTWLIGVVFVSKDFLQTAWRSTLFGLLLLEVLVVLLWVVIIYREESSKKRTADGTPPRSGSHKLRGIVLASLFAFMALSGFGAHFFEKAWTKHQLAAAHASEHALLKEWGYPPDLVEKQGQLDFLKLGPSVTAVSWLSSNLSTLDLTGTKVEKIEKLSPVLTTLLIGETRLTQLPGGLSGLTNLDLHYSAISDLDGLPAHLERINLERVMPRGPVVLPDSVVDLTISGQAKTWLARMPANLTTLTLIDAPADLLAAIPDTVKVLVLVNPQVGKVDLSSLPRNIESLTIDGGALDDLASLPPALITLNLKHTEVADLCGLVENNSGLDPEQRAKFDQDRTDLPDHLNELSLLNVETREPFCGLPDNLTKLAFLPSKSIPALDYRTLPRSLRALSIIWPASQRLTDLPPRLEELTISWAEVSDLGEIPSYVKKLDVSNSRIAGFEDKVPDSIRELRMKGCPKFELQFLPENLELLDVQGCKNLRHLPRIPLSLRTLNVARTDLSSLRDLPKGLKLKTLDISNTPIRTLDNLPEYLESLTLSEGQVESLRGLPESVRSLSFEEAIPRMGSQ